MSLHECKQISTHLNIYIPDISHIKLIIAFDSTQKQRTHVSAPTVMCEHRFQHTFISSSNPDKLHTLHTHEIWPCNKIPRTKFKCMFVLSLSSSSLFFPKCGVLKGGWQLPQINHYLSIYFLVPVTRSVKC